MSRTRTRKVLYLGFLAIIVGLTLLAGVPAHAQSDYEITVPNAIDIPDREVSIDDSDFLVTEISQVEKGQDIEVSVSAPNEEYDVYLYNHKSQIEYNGTGQYGDSELSIPTDDRPPGTYYLAALESDYQAVYPVIIQGYDVGLEAPNTVERGETVEVSVPVTATASSGDPHEVQVVLGDELRRVDATESDGTYTASIETTDLEPGEYPIYGVTRGKEETDDGRKIVLGLSSRQTLSVDDPTPTPTESDESDSSGSSGGSSGGSTGDTGDSDDATPTASPTPTPSPTASPTTVGPSTETGTESPTASPTERDIEPSSSPTASPSPTPSPTDDGVITPATATTTRATPAGTPTPTGGQPGFGVVVVLLSVAALVVLRRR